MNRRKIIAAICVLAVCFVYIMTMMLQARTQASPVLESFRMTTGTVTVRTLNVRQGPSATFDRIAQVHQGETLQIFGRHGNWYVIVEPKSGMIGAVSSAFVRITTGGGGGDDESVGVANPNVGITNQGNTNQRNTVNQENHAHPTAAAGQSSPTPRPTEPGATGVTNILEEEQNMLDAINNERARAGVPPLGFDLNLVNVARLKANDMVENNYFAHQSPRFGSPFDMMKMHRINFRTAGENIAGNNSAENAVAAWMNSQAHRQNILSTEFNFIGIGIAESQEYGNIYVGMFIGR